MILWAILLIGCLPIGVALLHRLGVNAVDRSGDRLILALWLGVVILAVSLLGIALVLPLTPTVGGLVLSLWGVWAIAHLATRAEVGRFWRQFWATLQSPRGLWWGVLLLGIAAFMSQPVTWIDTGLYHYSAIQWLSKFGAVPGNALLFSHLGFTSSWLALAAPFNSPLAATRLSATTNGFALLLLALHLAMVCTHIRQRPRLADWFALCCFGPLLLLLTAFQPLRVILISPSPDIPVLILVGLVAWVWLLLHNQPQHNLPRPHLPQSWATPSTLSIESPEQPYTNGTGQPAAVVLILALGAFSFKLTALPLLLVASLYCGFQCWRGAQRLGLGLALSGLLLVPQLLVSAVSSGCPLYPYTQVCLPVAWAPKVEAARQLSSLYNWTQWYTRHPEFQAASWLQLLWQWLNLSRLNQAACVAGLLSLGLVVLVVRSHVTTPYRGQIWLLLLAVTGIGFFLVTSPLLRFGMPYLILLPAFVGGLGCQILLPVHRGIQSGAKWSNASGRSLTGLVFCITVLAIAQLQPHLLAERPVFRSLLMPPLLPQTEYVTKFGRGFQYFSPNDPDGVCWAIPIPCAFEVETNPTLRNSTQGLKGGFIH
ncbi:MAG: hypothetical protein KME20_16515 [Kaiparowitsia implicata GSE-PSE-MK54-09C]|nr:hypothetical protein [Kaiparowitsia implicata GSE-PSE-MK54-09C]